MKLSPSFIIILLFAAASIAQTHAITPDEYDKATRLTVPQTRAPFIFTIRTEFVENGKIVSTVTEVDETEPKGRERITRTTVRGGKTTRQFQIVAASDRYYCSDDGIAWKGPSPDKCFEPVSSYPPRRPESFTCSVKDKTLYKVYREYSVFAPLTPDGKKEFREELATVGPGALLRSVVTTEGTLDPTTITLVRHLSWQTKARIKPIAVP